jgi:hypothetical protein
VPIFRSLLLKSNHDRNLYNEGRLLQDLSRASTVAYASIPEAPGYQSGAGALPPAKLDLSSSRSFGIGMGGFRHAFTKRSNSSRVISSTAGALPSSVSCAAIFSPYPRCICLVSLLVIGTRNLDLRS